MRTLQRIFDDVQIGGSYTYFDWDLRERFKGLKHAKLEEQLRSIIKNKTLSGNLRRLVVDIAEVCELSGLVPDILAQALDKTDDYLLLILIKKYGGDVAKTNVTRGAHLLAIGPETSLDALIVHETILENTP